MSLIFGKSIDTKFFGFLVAAILLSQSKKSKIQYKQQFTSTVAYAMSQWVG